MKLIASLKYGIKRELFIFSVFVGTYFLISAISLLRSGAMTTQLIYMGYIFSIVFGLNYREAFNLFIQNGLSRAKIALSQFIVAIVLALSSGIVLTLLQKWLRILFKGRIVEGEGLTSLGDFYARDNILINILINSLVYLTLILVFFLLANLFSRIPGKWKIILILGMIIIPTIVIYWLTHPESQLNATTSVLKSMLGLQGKNPNYISLIITFSVNAVILGLLNFTTFIKRPIVKVNG